MDGNDNPVIITTDNIVGILIHESNKLASGLAANGANVNWDVVERHLEQMHTWAQRAHGIVKDAALTEPAQPN